MLSIMRQKAGSWIIKVILFAIVVVFVFWGVGSFRSGQATRLAEINGEVVSYDTYRQAYERLRDQYRQAYGTAYDENMLKSLNLEDQALNQVVNRVLMLQEAQRLNIKVADETLDREIMNIPAFQSEGIFDPQRANLLLSRSRISTAQFRQSYREDLTLGQLRAVVMDGVTVSDVEAREWYNWYNAQVDLDYMLFRSDRNEDVELTDEQISQFFETQKEAYRTAPEVKVRYIFFDPKNYEDQVEITAEQIADYYHSHPEEFSVEKSVEARHILFKLDAQADSQEVDAVKQKAMTIYEKAKAGQPFEELAKQYSEGPTRDKGGYLGAFKREAMVKPFADRAFAMQAGEISEPVRTRFGWHIIKVEKVNEARKRSLEESSEQIKGKQAEVQAKALAFNKAEAVYDTTYDGDNLESVAQTHGLPLKTTGFFTAKGTTEPGIDNVRQFTDTAFGLQEMAVSEILDLGNGYCLLQPADRKASVIPPLDDVREKVTADLLKKKKDDMARADAQRFLEKVRQEDDFAAAGAQFGLTPMQTGFFKRSGAIPKIGYEPGISKAAFALTPENPLADQLFKSKQGWLVVRLNARKPPEPAEGFEKEKETIVDRLTAQKKQSVFQQWISDLRRRGKVEINRKMIQ
ncbi:MAG: SurA N-terminal domain-containing protein [Desulfatitalea sp.]|nr:SurA N-terminal domain-containing protein [Desulfatitalea sp.]